MLHTILLGIVEGITEFLPVSSTFHLIWTSTLLGISQTEFVKLFEVVIQGGAILAVVFIYWKEILSNFTLFKKLIASFIPTAVVGLVLYKIIKGVFFENTVAMTIVFIIVGIVFLIVEYLIRQGRIKIDRDIRALSMKQAVLVGLFQALAVMPGVSRAGAVMIGMMFMGTRRDEAAKYSFMLAIPTILAATALDLFEMRDVLFSNTSYLSLLFVGTVISFVAAIFVIRWLIKYLQTNSLVLFGWYRVIVGIILLLSL